MRTANNALVRAYNENRVRQALLRLRETTRQRLALETGLSQMTVSTVIAALMAGGEVEQVGSAPSEGGRPSARYRYRGEQHKGAVLFTYQRKGKTYVCLRVYDLFGDLWYREEQFFDEIRMDSFDQMLERAFRKTTGIRALTIGLPAHVWGGEVLYCDHPALTGGGLVRRCTALLGVPVRLLNDVNAATLGYVQRRPPRQRKELTAGFYFTTRFGPGMGLVVGQELWEGHRSFVGEFHGVPSGPSWLQIDYRDRGSVREAVTDALQFACGMAGPDRAVLYGEVFWPGAAEEIAKGLDQRFHREYGLELEVVEDPEEDYEEGMKVSVLREVKQQLFGDHGEE